MKIKFFCRESRFTFSAGWLRCKADVPVKPGIARVSMIGRVITATAVVLSVARLNAGIYQVGPTRSYTNRQAVTKRLAPGDVVEVDSNAAYSGNITFDNHGTPANPATIRGVRVNEKRPVISGVNGFSGGAVVRFRADYYLFEGFEVTGGGDPKTGRGLYNLGDHVTVRDWRVVEEPLIIQRPRAGPCGGVG
jgi:hypothetical protein